MSTNFSTAMILAEDPARQAEALAMVGFLAGYCGTTRTSYATDLRIFAAWCHESDLSTSRTRLASSTLSACPKAPILARRSTTPWRQLRAPTIRGCSRCGVTR